MSAQEETTTTTTTTTTKEADASSTISPSSYRPEDLIELIRAIKFVDPKASIQAVHDEITNTMSRKPNFDFLKNVELNEVISVWEKATDESRVKSVEPSSKKNGTDLFLGHDHPDSAKVIKLYTVGDGTVKTEAIDCTLTDTAAASLAAKGTGTEVEENSRDEELKKYVHIFLNVPADRSGSRPHQALINFNENRVIRAGKNATRNKKNKRGKHKTAVALGKSAAEGRPSKGEETTTRESRDIVKIQVAAPISGTKEETDTVMLLYNADRSVKTFIHPRNNNKEEEENDEGVKEVDGYHRIKRLILNWGVCGSLGASGGTKGYFYARITRRSEGQDIISVDVTSGLAPPQKW